MELDVQPTCGLASLPGPAFECVIRHLIDLGSGRLPEMLRCSKEVRSMVLETAQSITYLPGLARDTANHSDVCVVARRAAPLALTIDMEGCDCACMTRMLRSAAAASWTAVTKLSIWVSAANQHGRANACTMQSACAGT